MLALQMQVRSGTTTSLLNTMQQIAALASGRLPAATAPLQQRVPAPPRSSVTRVEQSIASGSSADRVRDLVEQLPRQKPVPMKVR